MKKTILIAFAIIMMMSCKKENINNSVDYTGMVKSIRVNGTGFFSNYTDSFYYDNQKRIIKQVRINNGSLARTSYLYNYYTDSVVKYLINPDNPALNQLSEKYFLNVNGKAYLKEIYSTGIPIPPSRIYYTLDASNFLLKDSTKNTNYSTVINYTNNNENNTLSITKYSNSIIYNKYTYTFTDTINSISNDLKGMKFLPTSNKNAIKIIQMEERQPTPNGDFILELRKKRYTYVLDANKRIIQIDIIDSLESSQNQTYIISYY
jgi:hypothetical protein